MKIKRFNESEEVDISSERIQEITKNLKEFSSQLTDNIKMIESLSNELSNYTSSSKKGNDQVDDSISTTQILKESLENCLDNNNSIIKNLTDYDQSGRKYLYTEK